MSQQLPKYIFEEASNSLTELFYSGNPLIECELRRVSIQTARSIISLSSEELEPDEADSTQVRQIMALKAFDEFVGSKCHVVVEVQDVDNKDLFPLVAPDFAEVIVTHDIIGRLMLQCARCPGLAPVLESMVSIICRQYTWFGFTLSYVLSYS